MKSIVVIGDILIEKQYFHDDYLYSPIGGAGNLALNLAIANPQNTIFLIAPYIQPLYKHLMYTRLPNNLYINEMFEETPKTQCYGERIRFNRSETQKTDLYSISNWDHFFVHGTLNLASIISKAEMLAIEWHYPGERSIASILPHILTTMDEEELMVPPVYLDARSPSTCSYNALKPMFWKMNRREAYSLPNDFNYDGYKLMTLGKDGVVLEGKEKRIEIEGTHHPRIYEIGCGDTFSAYFITSYLKGYDLEHCLSIANMAAGFACSIPGVIAVRPEDIIFDYCNFERGVNHLDDISRKVSS